MENAIQSNPDLEQRFNQGVELLRAGQWAEAEALYRRILSQQMGNAVVHDSLAVALRHQGKWEQAAAAVRTALVLRPNYPEAWMNLGSILRGMNQPAEAIEAHRKALELQPDLPIPWNNMGNALRTLNRLPEAIEAYEKAISLRPNFAEAWSNLGNTLRDVQKPTEAIEAFRRALEYRPNLAETWSNLGNALREMTQLPEAIEAFRRALALRPDVGETWCELGNAYRDMNQLSEAIDAYRKSISLRPDLVPVWNNLAGALKDAGQVGEAISCFEKVIALEPGNTTALGMRLFNLHYHPDSNSPAIAQAAKLWNEVFTRPLAGEIRVLDNDPDPRRRLRVGYVSQHFRLHCESIFTLPLLAHHDHEAFEIFGYCNVKTPDSMTAKLQSLADVWRNIEPYNDQPIADLIRKDKIDILVDLAMHTTRNRLGVFARKPLIQVTWLGYPGTTGLETMDYRLTDPWLDPPELEGPSKESGTASGAIPIAQLAVSWSKQAASVNQDTADSLRSPAVPLGHGGDGRIGIQHPFYSERSVYLPDGYWCYDPAGMAEGEVGELPLPGPLPALTAGHVTFGSLNNFCKINDPVLELWAWVLAAVPDARILLMAAPGRHRDWVVEKLGVARERVQFVEWQKRRQYLETYRRIDVGLDTLPFNGGTTSLDALWMGVPVITLVGDTVVGRAGSSHLNRLGLPELVTRTEQEFVQRAVDLSEDFNRLSSLRGSLRRRMESSPLMDGSRFTRDMESAYRQMWQAWCRTRSQ